MKRLYSSRAFINSDIAVHPYEKWGAMVKDEQPR